MKLTFSFVAALINIILLNSNINAQWVDTGCPFGGYVNAIAIDEPRIFIGTDQAGVYRSTDNGDNWSQANTGLTSLSVSALAFSGTNLFAGTSIGGIFRSSDYGASWVEVNNGLSVLFINTLAVSGSNIFAGAKNSVTGGGVFLSTNNGDNWMYVGLTDYEVYSLAISGNNIFAGTDNGVFLSTNNGTNWTEVNSGLTEDDVYALKVSNNNLYAGTSNGMFYSSDNGLSWTNISTSSLENKSVRSIAIHQINIIVGTAGWGAYVSTNNGITWEESDEGLPNSFTEIYALEMSGTTLYAGTLFQGAWGRPLTDYITDVESISDNLPQSFQLSQNYPNPFNPTTTISFDLPQQEIVVIKVYDILGRKVATLLNETKHAGRYSAVFDASSHPSGVYIYEITAGEFSDSKKMQLLK